MDPAPVQSLPRAALARGVHHVIAPFDAEEMLHRHAHSISGKQPILKIWIVPAAVFRRNGDITEDGGIPMKARPFNVINDGSLQIANHVFNDIGVIRVLMIKTFPGATLPIVVVEIFHPSRAFVGPDQDFVVVVERNASRELRQSTACRSTPVRGALHCFHVNPHDSDLSFEFEIFSEPILVFIEPRQTDLIGHWPGQFISPEIPPIQRAGF
jgi:hypothetical protein